MAASLLITIDDGSGRSSTDLSQLVQQSGNLSQEVNALINYLASFPNGAATLNVSLSSSALVAATANIACSSVQAGDTVTINGVVFTATTSAAAANEFNIGASNTTCAAAIVTSVNASTTAKVLNQVTASSVSGTVTLTANPAGIVGNVYSLASSNGGRLAVTGFSGGTGGLGTSTSQYLYNV